MKSALAVAALLVAALVSCGDGAFSGATMYVDNALLTKITTPTIPAFSQNLNVIFAFPALTAATLPNMSSCTVSHDVIQLSSSSVQQLNAQSDADKILLSVVGLTFQTQSAAFNVKCSINTPAGYMEMSTAGYVSFSGNDITLQELSVVQSGTNNATTISTFSPVAGALPTVAPSYLYSSNNKFPFDAYVNLYFQSVLTQAVSQYAVSTVAQSATNVCGAAISNVFALFKNPCSFDNINGSLALNLSPVCSTLQDVPLPSSDLRMMAPASNYSARSGASCTTTQCWPYAILANNWTLTYSHCSFCLSADGKTVGQSATVSVFLP